MPITHVSPELVESIKLRWFERFVQQQQPATQPWQPVTDYSYEARKAIEGQHPQLIKDVFQPRRVTDAGCGPDAILVRLLRDVGVKAIGFDLQDASFDVLSGDLTDDGQTVRYIGTADLVVNRECLEHLTVLQIRRAVRNLVRLSSKYVYLTTRFHPNPSHLLDVQDHDDLDPTHITLLSKDFLRLLFVLEGCKSRPDLEERLDWRQLGRCLVFEVA
jgi:SAM-dependent methyltransferase